MNDQDRIDARNRLGAGRIIAKNMQPYFSRGLDSMETVEKYGTGRITVDKYWRLYYDPEYCLSLTAKEVASEWLHNINHLFRGHPERFENLDGANKNRSDFNFSADAIINSELRKEGVTMPDPMNKPYLEDGVNIGWKQGMPVEQLYWLTVHAKSSKNDSEGLENQDATSPREEQENPSAESTEPDNGNSSDDDNDKDNSNQHSSDKDASNEDSLDSQSEEDGQQNSGLPAEDESSQKDTEEAQEQDFHSDAPSEQNDPSDKNGSPNAEDKSGESEPSEANSSDNNDAPSENSNTQGDSDEDHLASSDPSMDEDLSEADGGDTSSGLIPQSQNSDHSRKNTQGNTSVDEEQTSDLSKDSEVSQNPDSIGSDDEDFSNDGLSERHETEKAKVEREYVPYENVDEAKPDSDEYDCGSGAGGEPREWEDDPDEKAMDPTNAEILKTDIAKDMINHEQSNPGSIPGGLLRDAQIVLEPEYDWIKEFINLIRKIAGASYGKLDHTYSRMSKKQSSKNSIILPGWQSPDPFEVAAIIDTSGSMEEKTDLALALGLLNDLLKKFGGDSTRRGLHLISCDAGATISFAKELDSVELHGGGGTDMRVGIKAASEIKPMLDVIITITDGGTPWPKEVPAKNRKAKYIALLVGDAQKRGIPDWMHVIEVKIPRSRSQFKPYSEG